MKVFPAVIKIFFKNWYLKALLQNKSKVLFLLLKFWKGNSVMRKTTKKLLVIALVVGMLTTLCACGENWKRTQKTWNQTSKRCY